jgi:hypothetical protein
MSESSNFDLEHAIQLWRSELQQLPAFRGADIDELEGHLRDAIVALQSRSLTEEEAFWLARRRLGTPECLEREFRPVNAGHLWQQRALWMLAGFLAISTATSFSSSLVRLILAACHNAGLPANFTFWLHPLLLLGCLGGFIVFASRQLERFNKPDAFTGNRWNNPWKAGLLLLGIIGGAQLLGALAVVVALHVASPSVLATWFGGPGHAIYVLFWPALFVLMLRRIRRDRQGMTRGHTPPN